MNYIEVKITVSPKEPGTDILITRLAECGFESFEETSTGVNAYIQSELFYDNMNEIIPVITNPDFNISYEKKVIQQQNWNELWEKSFEPVVVAGKCCIRASFHKSINDAVYDIIINPKMSFGTGHHQTTHLMISEMLNMDFENKAIADAGCGTAVLAILASKMKAATVFAYDTDEWSIENSKENIVLNNTKNIILSKGNSTLLHEKLFNVILANINKNVLLADMERFSYSLTKGGDLLLSGFFIFDREELISCATKHKMKLINEGEKEKWCLLHFKKSE